MADDDEKKNELIRMSYALLFPCILLAVLWTLRLWEWNFQTNLHWLGVYPRTLSGLLGILTEPLVHGSAKHLFSNSVPLLVLSWCLFYFYKDTGYAVFPILWLLSGFITWCIGRESYHIGASGVIYGLAFFLFFSGIVRRHVPLMTISILVAFLYGSMVWYMMPAVETLKENISWEGHLSGAVSGFLCAFAFKRYGPQRPEEPFEEEDDDEQEDKRYQKDEIAVMFNKCKKQLSLQSENIKKDDDSIKNDDDN